MNKNLGPQIILLRKENKTYNQIAEILSCSKSIVSYHLGYNQKQKSLNRNKKNLNKQTEVKKTKKEYRCKHCNTLLRIGYSKNDYSTTCEKCNKNKINWNIITLDELKKDKSIYQYHARIRSLARYYTNITPCRYCGYDKHVEFCHIKPISSFSKDQTVGEVNSPDNIICLCPNHHWELDNNVLLIETILNNPLLN